MTNQLIYGRHPIIDAIQSGTPLDKLLLQQGIRGDFEKEIRHYSKKFNIPLQVVPKERLNRLIKGNHQGIAGYLSLIRYDKLEDVIPILFEKNDAPLLVLLDGVTDVRNLGAIARSAECLGAQALVIGKKNSAQINAEALKTSAGALTKIPVCREGSLIKATEFLIMSGIQVVASSLHADKKIFDIDFQLPTAIVVGSEGKGVNPALLKAATETFIIPQSGRTDSLNVSVAAGVILYEASRQRSD